MHDSIQIQILEELSYSFLLSYIQQHFNNMSEFKATQADSTECKQENYNARQSLQKSSKPQTQKEHRNDSENLCRQSATYQEEPRDDIRVRSRRTYNVITNVQTEIENTIKKEILNMKSCLENQLIHIRNDYANLSSKMDLLLNTWKPTPPKEFSPTKQYEPNHQENLNQQNKNILDGYYVASNKNLFQVEQKPKEQVTTLKRQYSRSRSRSRSRSCSCRCCSRLVQSRKKGRKQRKNSSDSSESNYSGKMTAEQVRMIVQRLRNGTLSVQDAARKCGRRECVIQAWLRVY